MSKHKIILLLSSIHLFTLIMIALLQISQAPWLFVWLVLMHLGFIGIGLTKKRNKTYDLNIYTKKIFISFLLFIPILIYKVIVLLSNLVENHTLVSIFTIALMIVSAAIGVMNYLDFKKKYMVTQKN